jgi:iron complex outermembrane receptor protein
MCVSASAQDSIYHLAAPVIVDSFQRSFSEYNQEYFTENRIKTLGIAGPVSEMLLFNACGITRSNGPGKVTTFSKHGLPAEHTRVYWNNIELNSPLNGIVDFSTLPSFLLSNQTDLYRYEDVRIRLKPQKLPDNKTRLLFNTGSYHQIDVGLKHSISIGKSIWNFGGEYIQNKSNFQYQNDLKQRVRQVHGDYEQFHGSLDVHLPFSNRSNLSLSALYSEIKTNIPPTFFQRSSKAHQKNYPLKILAKYAQQLRQSVINFSYGTNIEYLRYQNSDLNLDAKHKFWRHTVDIDYQRSLKHNIQLEAKITETYEVGQSDNFSNRHQNINSESSLGLSKAWNDNLILTASLGILYGRDILSPLQYKTQLTYMLRDKHRIRGIVQSLYRLPTYNELYWSPGGNINLSPESGSTFLLDYFYSGKQFKFEIGSSLHRIGNRILWLPQNSGIFSPINIGDIGSEELHLGFNFNPTFQKLICQLGFRYTYLSARIINNTQIQSEDGKNLPFTPRHAFTQHIGITWNSKISCSIHGKYQSKSFTNSSNTAYLPEFYVMQGQLRYHAAVQSHDLTLFLKINNMTNTDYLLSNGYPQPPRHWQAGFTVLLNRKR